MTFIKWKFFPWTHEIPPRLGTTGLNGFKPFPCLFEPVIYFCCTGLESDTRSIKLEIQVCNLDHCDYNHYQTKWVSALLSSAPTIYTQLVFCRSQICVVTVVLKMLSVPLHKISSLLEALLSSREAVPSALARFHPKYVCHPVQTSQISKQHAAATQACQLH